MQTLVKIIGPAPSEMSYEELLEKIAQNNLRVQASFEAFRLKKFSPKKTKKSKSPKLSFKAQLEAMARAKLIEAGLEGDILEQTLKNIIEKGL